MDSLSSPVEMFFFPFVGGGHQIPMIDMARMFAAHGAKCTIVATPKHALSFRESILRDQRSGHRIFIETLSLPDNIDLANTDMTASALTDTSMLQEPLTKLLLQRKPDCIVHDMFHHWAVGAIDNLELNISRIVFNGNGCFAGCIRYNVTKFRPHETVDSKYEPFVVPELPDRIELTPSQMPVPAFQFVEDKMLKATDNCYGVVVNSFYELEPAYVEQSRKANKAWIVGPVSLYNRNIADKAERGKKAAVDEQSILSWLHSKEPESVLYISFGSVGRLSPAQILEIAYGLQASNQPFIWVVGTVFNGEETWFPTGFEEKIKESEQGLIINGWAPQLLILEHRSIGGFMTHCGWNSVLEGVSCGVPMITWPKFADQFYNEKLVTDVLKVGVKVGSLDWLTWNMESQRTVGRDKVEAAVKRLMGGGEEGVEMRNKAKLVGEMAKKAVEEGGSSYKDVICLINELEDRRKRSRPDV
ncbi:UDP-glycosyltransferase 73B4 [Hibiscus trionum]|uniref:Glycosyltransferase n=1 Tax=Hibiscus trionum TaxID=183268 RepID=A0A9W7LRF6_HIBTR|nr:UDP-glycosyltransferase 73B4 [Hibiscus trionum]